MKNIIPKLSSNLSKMWLRIINHENCLFPEIKEQLGTLSVKFHHVVPAILTQK